MGLAIFWEHVANVERLKFQYVTQVLFVFFPRKSSQRPSTICDGVCVIGFCDRIVQGSEQRLTIGIGQHCGIGRHFTGIDAIMNQNPAIP